VGNWEGAAALEMTLAGGSFEFQSDTGVALTGADCDASIPMWRAVEVTAGDQIRCGQMRTGARCYLCVAGGIDVPLVLGSTSTHLLTALGGLEGRALKRGDVLAIGETRGAVLRGTFGRPAPPPAIRVTKGPQADWFDTAQFLDGAWQVRQDSDRMGLRLSGPALKPHAGQMLTEGVSLGAVQVPPDGQPIILFVDHQTTGGYPKIANAISADFGVLGQLRPGDRVRFELVTMEVAHELLRAQEEWLHSLGGAVG
jgi:antagonist of KipI